MLHWNIIHKSTGVTWNVGPYKLIRLPMIHGTSDILHIIYGTVVIYCNNDDKEHE